MKRIFLIFLSSFLLVGFANAIPILNFFDTTPGVGTMTWTGGLGGTVTLSGEPIISLSVSGAPINNGTYLIDGPITTNGALGTGCSAPNGNVAGSCGTSLSTTGGAIFVSPGVVAFGPGGSLSLTGSLDCGPATPFCITNGFAPGFSLLGTGPIIVSGSFTSASLSLSTLTLSEGGVGSDFKNPTFLAFFGITNPNFAFTLSANALAPPGYVPPAAFSVPLQGGSITNFGVVTEPSALLLLGTGLLAVAGVLRRKLLG